MWYRTLCFLIVHSSLFAQESRIDTTQMSEVYIQESRFQIPFSKYNRDLKIIDSEALQKLPVQSVQEALSWIGGIDLRQRGPFGTQADVSIQGGSFEQTLVLLNGLKISDAQTGHHSLNIPIPLIAVERIEILQGPAARIYGMNALTGAINIVTKNHIDNRIEVNMQVGSSFKSKASGDGKGKYVGTQLDILLASKHKILSHGLAVSGLITNGQRYNTAAGQYKIWYSGHTEPQDNSQVSWYAGHIQNEFGANAYYAAPIDREAEEEVATSLFGLQYNKQFGRVRISPNISYRRNKDDYRFNRFDWSKSRSQHVTNVISSAIQSILDLDYAQLGIGWESRVEYLQSTNMGKHQRMNHGLFAEMKLEPIPNFSTQLGSYINYNSNYGWSILPGLDMGYNVSSSWRLRGSLNAGARLPSFTDLYLNQAPANIGNANLYPEHAWQYDIGVQYQGYLGKVDLNYFHRTIDNFIDWMRADQQRPYQPQNLGNSEVSGIGIQYANTILSSQRFSLKQQVHYNFLSPIHRDNVEVYTSKYAIEHLRHQFAYHLQARTENWTLSGHFRQLKRTHQKSYSLIDLKSSYNVSKWSFSVHMNNILGERYSEIAAIPLPSRWLTLGIHMDI